MKISIKILLIIEVQVILLLVVFALVRMETLHSKVYNTNKYLHEVLTDNKLETLNAIRDNDIIVGNADAPVTIYLYSRFDCSACNSFFKDNYIQLKTEFIDKGLVKLVIRYLVHQSKSQTLYIAKCAYYANQAGYYDSFLKQLDSMYPSLDTSIVKNFMIDLTTESKDFQIFIKNINTEKELLHLANDARAANIVNTPTIFINNQRLIGYRKYEKLKSIIVEELNNIVCEQE